MADITHAQLHQIAGPKLAIDRQIEQRKIPTPARDLQARANCPNLFELKGGFLAYELAFVPRFAVVDVNAMVSMIGSCCCGAGSLRWRRKEPNRP